MLEIPKFLTALTAAFSPLVITLPPINLVFRQPHLWCGALQNTAQWSFFPSCCYTMFNVLVIITLWFYFPTQLWEFNQVLIKITYLFTAAVKTTSAYKFLQVPTIRARGPQNASFSCHFKYVIIIFFCSNLKYSNV